MYYGYGYGLNYKSSGVAFDVDAQAFITAASITDPTQQGAVNQLVLDLKAANIWTKMKAVYPFVGGSASSHKFNLKDPRDLDAAYRLTFSGGWTHGSTGILPNGTNAYADTFLNNNVMAQNSIHISASSRTSTSSVTTLISSWNSGFGTSIYPYSSGSAYCNNNSTTQGSKVNANSFGFYINTRVSSTDIIIQRDSSQSTVSITSNSHIATSFKIGKTGEANAEYADRELAFASIGDGLNSSEALALNTAFQTFKTTLGR